MFFDSKQPRHTKTESNSLNNNNNNEIELYIWRQWKYTLEGKIHVTLGNCCFPKKFLQRIFLCLSCGLLLSSKKDRWTNQVSELAMLLQFSWTYSMAWASWHGKGDVEMQGISGKNYRRAEWWLLARAFPMLLKLLPRLLLATISLRSHFLYQGNTTNHYLFKEK